MITENLSTLKIHKLTQEQYDRELAAGNINESALYLTPDKGISITTRETVIIDGPHTESRWLHTVYNNGDEEYDLLSPYGTAAMGNGGPSLSIPYDTFGIYTIDHLTGIDFSEFTNIAIVGNAYLTSPYNGITRSFPIFGFTTELNMNSELLINGYVYIPKEVDGVETSNGGPGMSITNMHIKLIK